MNELAKEKFYLFLDDDRHPSNTYLWDENCFLHEMVNISSNKWVIVRSYDQFVQMVEQIGIPDVISFDNNICGFFNFDVSEDELEKVFLMEDWRNLTIKTGAHCAEWLVNRCKEQNHPIPEYYVHSVNIRARKIIREIMENGKQNNQIQN